MDCTAESLLRELCTVVMGALPVDGVGVTLVETDGLRSVHALPSALFGVERRQEGLRQGPRQSCVAGLRPVGVDDITDAAPWLESAGACPSTGMRSVLAVPLVARGRARGVLTLYRAHATPWEAQNLAIVGVLADVAAGYLMLAVERDSAGLLHEDLEYRVTHDELTGLPNRGLLFDRLEHALLTAPRQRTTVAALFVDIDNFKGVNDTIGHAYGDAVLVEVARRLTLVLRADDTVGRLAGDEFLVVCEALTGSPQTIGRRLRVLGQRIRQCLANSPDDDDLGIEVSVSIGAAVATDRHTAEQVIGDADRAMYAAKRAGGGCLVINGPEVVSMADFRLGRARRSGR
jgi:diguanylate cyclase (GGDEF)-like protein